MYGVGSLLLSNYQISPPTLDVGIFCLGILIQGRNIAISGMALRDTILGNRG